MEKGQKEEWMNEGEEREREEVMIWAILEMRMKGEGGNEEKER